MVIYYQLLNKMNFTCHDLNGNYTGGFYTDISGIYTPVAMAILAGINVLVIIQGLISCKHKLGLHPKKKCDILNFYMLAFMSLGAAIVYCLSELISETLERQ